MRSTVSRKYAKCSSNVTSNMLPATEKYTGVQNNCQDEIIIENVAFDETPARRPEELEHSKNNSISIDRNTLAEISSNDLGTFITEVLYTDKCVYLFLQSL